VIEELNLLADLARSAAATEAGTYITNKSLGLLKDRVAEFTEKYSKQYPELEPVIKTAFEEADQHKDEIAELLKKYKASRDADPALVRLRRGIVALGVISPELNQTLSSLLLNVEQYVTAGETNLAKARENIEDWFNDSMERLTGVFKRYSQLMALIIGFFIALFLNIDSINLTGYLWREPSVRQVLAERATAAVDEGGIVLPSDFQTDPYKAMQDFRQQFIGLGLPVGWTIKAKSDPLFEGANCTIWPQGKDFFGISVSDRCISSSPPDHSTNWAVKLVGIILTAVAAAQGAPFWFDILKKVVNLRSTGANPAEQASK
jgi:hypothetical protein